MKTFHTNLGLALAASLLLASCSGVQEKTSQLQDKANQAQDLAKQAQETANNAKGAMGNLGNLKDSITPLTEGTSQTLAAVKAGDFTKAQAEFTKLQDSWKGVEGTLKTVSPDATKTIGEKIGTIATDLKSGSPDAGKLTTELQGLSTALGGLAAGGGASATTAARPTADSTATGSTATGEKSAASSEATSGNAAGSATTGEKSAASPEATSGSATSSAANSATSSTANIQSNLMAMKDELAKATTAVESKDFAAAKESFGSARQTWYKFGGSVKQQSPDVYQKLDTGVKSVNLDLSQAEPSPDKALTGLKALSTDLNSVK